MAVLSVLFMPLRYHTSATEYELIKTQGPSIRSISSLSNNTVIAAATGSYAWVMKSAITPKHHIK
jgi:hypothetical protein